MSVGKDLLKILACPKCKSTIKLQNMFLTCSNCRLAYPILDDVPDMLIQDAWKLDKARKVNFKHKLKL